MTTCGLPADAAPSLAFPVNEKTLLTVNQRFRIQWEGLDDYLIIGSNGSGDPICIDITSEDEIVYLNHDNSFEDVRINSSICQLSLSLLAYKVFYMSLINQANFNDFSPRIFSDAEFSQLQDEFREIDFHALDQGNFWQMELDALLWERDHE